MSLSAHRQTSQRKDLQVWTESEVQSVQA
eukprot:SAG31_NODE_39696_length_286_cov_0.834225_1_plen_28_part_10